LDRDRPQVRRGTDAQEIQVNSHQTAVRAGHRLTLEEIAALLEQRELAQDSHHRPHGRPTSLLLTLAELGKQFRRT
jgi:DNA mismatch repair protein MutL